MREIGSYVNLFRAMAVPLVPIGLVPMPLYFSRNTCAEPDFNEQIFTGLRLSLSIE